MYQHRPLCILFVLAFLPASAQGETLLHERFANNPIAAGRASVTSGDAERFSHAENALTASYDTSLPTAKLAWPLGATLNSTTSFQMSVQATLLSGGFSADPNRFAQLAFGLVNSATTGDDRAGGRGGDAFDAVTVDYFPNISPIFGGPSLGPTAIASNSGAGFFSSIQFPFNLEGGLDDESPLPLDTLLEYQLDYDAAGSLLTLRVLADGSALPINANQPDFDPGGFDGDATTIQLSLDAGTSFSVDQFALLLWQDTFLPAGAAPSVRADWRFSEIVVSTPDQGVPGDTNADGRVDLEDLNNVRNHFGDAGPGPGDAFPRDGIVDLNDLNLVRNHFGAASSNVPEPESLALAFAVGAMVLVYHGGKRFPPR